MKEDVGVNGICYGWRLNNNTKTKSSLILSGRKATVAELG